MKKFHSIAAGCVLSLSLILSACGSGKNSGKGFNLFPVTDDIALGAQVAYEIDSNTREYPPLDSVRYKEVYAYLYKMRNTILNSGNVDYKTEFPWRVKVLHDDKVQNAFCTPGGYIYIYTGLLKFIDSEDQLAGVLAHEMGHADMRHSTRQMSKMFGTDLLISIIAGDRAALRQVTTALIGLKYSRDFETEADERSVLYLCPTPYNAAGGAGFFEKIESAGGASQPEFLSTHPSPANRIEHFHAEKERLGCQGNQTYTTEYKRMLSTLP